MNKQQFLLIALSTGGEADYTPVQVQKLVFLIERNVGAGLGGTGFNFAPYDYGPFDPSIYEELRALKDQGFVVSRTTPRGWPVHSLTQEGVRQGKELSKSVDPKILQYIAAVSDFVRKLSFSDLVSAIYKAYPEMKVNSVFRG
jgi:hypothetical protein